MYRTVMLAVNPFDQRPQFIRLMQQRGQNSMSVGDADRRCSETLRDAGKLCGSESVSDMQWDFAQKRTMASQSLIIIGEDEEILSERQDC